MRTGPAGVRRIDPRSQSNGNVDGWGATRHHLSAPWTRPTAVSHSVCPKAFSERAPRSLRTVVFGVCSLRGSVG
jgi:hypothetical protein